MAARLSTKLIRGITKPGRYFDAGTPGLHVFAQKRRMKSGEHSLSMSYVQRLTVQGVRRDIGIGSPRWITLTEARAAAMANYKTARKGGDPVADRRKAKIPSNCSPTSASPAHSADPRSATTTRSPKPSSKH